MQKPKSITSLRLDEPLLADDLVTGISFGYRGRGAAPPKPRLRRRPAGRDPSRALNMTVQNRQKLKSIRSCLSC
jgi:hypothetical protein